MEEFELYLIGKKINPKEFENNEPVRYQEFKALFGQVHPDSFAAQKLFLINQVRRRYPMLN
jgi:hypothetical protein